MYVEERIQLASKEWVLLKNDPEYLKKVEAEEKWLETHAEDQGNDTHYIHKI